MILGYNTNGLAFHEPREACQLLAELGYQAVGLTLDHGLLSPRDRAWRAQADALRDHLQRLGLRSVVETGARYLLDFRSKHEPTLVSAVPSDRARRVAFLCHAVDVAAALGSDAVSCWSGVVRDDAAADRIQQRLIDGLGQVLEYAERREVTIAFEPEPGMWIDTMQRFEQLLADVPSPRLRLTLDIGHLHCLGEIPLDEQIQRWGPWLANVHLEDMRRGHHEHLMFGEGEIDFPPVFAALRAAEYQGGVYVELSRHSHEGPEAARRAREFLREAFPLPANHPM